MNEMLRPSAHEVFHVVTAPDTLAVCHLSFGARFGIEGSINDYSTEVYYISFQQGERCREASLSLVHRA